MTEEPAEATEVNKGFWGWGLDKVRSLYREVAKFGAVGLIAFVVDVGLFNLFLYTDGSPLEGKPLTAKGASVVVATVVAYLGNRYWTFTNRATKSHGRAYLLFFALNAVAMLIAVACLWISHYLLGFTSALADNIAANVVGLLLGAVFRFWSYRRWVFPELPDEKDRDALIGTVEI